MNGTTLYHYDSQNRLRMAEYPGHKEELFYDRAGNRTRRLINGREELYRYDKRNRLTERVVNGETERFAYDAAGNLVEDGRARYEYDAFNRMTKTETFNGNIQINRYDPEGLRHEMEENGELVRFIFRDREVIAEEKEKGDIRYIRGRELLASDAERARTYYHYASDEMGSVTHVTAREEVLNRYEYDAWGNALTCEEQVANRFRFAGEQYDPISQQYYLRARFYNPVIGRFTQEDSYRGDGLNLYAYCQNNPVYYVDPSGHICEGVARQIMDKLNENQAGGNERKKLAKYLRDKVEHGEKLSSAESNAAKRMGLDFKRVAGDGEYTRKTRGRISVEGTYAPSATDSKILRDELHAAGVPSVTPYENDAHHIVPWNVEGGDIAKQILEDYGIDLNSAANGVFLPAKSNGYEGDAALHRGGHSGDYINEITKRLVDADIEARPNKDVSKIQDALNKIRSDLLTGKLKIFSQSGG